MLISYNWSVDHKVNRGVVGDDLLQLNHHILAYAGKHTQNVNLLLSLDDITVCVARLELGAEELWRTVNGDLPKKTGIRFP